MITITQTYDPAVYKLVSVDPDEPPILSDLPGVVTHSGEPVAYVDRDTLTHGGRLALGTALFTHADPAEVERLRQRVINAECETARLTLMLRELEAQLAAQPTPEAIVKATIRAIGALMTPEDAEMLAFVDPAAIIRAAKEGNDA